MTKIVKQVIGIYTRSQVSVYKTSGPLVVIFDPKDRLLVLVRTTSPKK